MHLQNTTDVEEIKNQICSALRMMYLKGLITPLTGNISTRVSDRLIVLTPSSFEPAIRLKYELRPSDLVEVDIDGNIIKGGKPTTELPMHLAVYRSCNKCRAIVHVHGIYSPLIKADEFSELFLDTEVKYILKPKICFVSEIIPRTVELAEAVAERVREGCEIIYLEGHGIVAVSSNLGMALELAELAEVIALRTIVYKLRK